MLTIKRAVLLALVAFVLRIRYDWQYRRNVARAVINTKAGQSFVLVLSRVLLGYLFPPILVHFHYRWPSHAAQDELFYMEGLKYVRRTRYGTKHLREELDELLPVIGQTFNHEQRVQPYYGFTGVTGLLWEITKEVFEFTLSAFDHHPHSIPLTLGRVKDDAPAILFGHGGGWCVQGTDVQLGQLFAIARQAQMALFTYNYPLSPENRFPDALVSTLRALTYLKANRGYDSVALVGESAGGNLITMAGLFLCNRTLLKQLAKETQSDLDQWDYPTISCVVSWYSILDEVSWRNTQEGWLSPGLATVFDLYRSKCMNGRLTICDYESELQTYPSTLLICGDYDPLGLLASSKACFKMLQRRGVDVALSTYHATHGFVGYPPAIQNALAGDDSHWKENCKKATFETVAFLRKHHQHNNTIDTNYHCVPNPGILN